MENKEVKELTREYILKTLEEEKLWKPGESDTFTFNNWEYTLRKEEEKYKPFEYFLDGKKIEGVSFWSRRYVSMGDAFLHIVNHLNENVYIKDKYNSLDEYIYEFKEEIKLLLEKAEDLEWSISVNKNEITFQKYSPCGQDFSFTITLSIEAEAEELIDKIDDYYESYDVSYEAYLWLDNTGHGINGAPDDMKDVYEDMEVCQNNVKELLDALKEV